MEVIDPIPAGVKSRMKLSAFATKSTGRYMALLSAVMAGAHQQDAKASDNRLGSIPVAEYLRVSTASQLGSLQEQAARIRAYASQHHFSIVRTYVDAGRSGLVLRQRPGLKRLLEDVLSGHTPYKAILVDDLSRWGRFQDTDESAHYEFACKQAGVQVHYCSEPFRNDGTLSSSIVKSLKRGIAGEYSRDLSVKCFNGQRDLARLGYRMGGTSGYGLRRIAISQQGSMYDLNSGEYKALKTDRVILAPGSQHEVHCVRKIFKLALAGKSLRAIARELNQQQIPYRGGREWKDYTVANILKNAKYAGTLVWNRTSKRLHQPAVRNHAEEWIVREDAFAGIVTRDVLDRVRQLLQKKQRRWSEHDLWQKLKELLIKRGCLSEKLIATTAGMPSLATLHRRLGSYRAIYRELRYVPDKGAFSMSDHRQQTQRLRDNVVEQITSLFPGRVAVTHLERKRRPIMQFANGSLVSILMCRRRQIVSGEYRWMACPAPAEREKPTLICFVNKRGDGCERYFLVPKMSGKRDHIFFADAGRLLKTGFRLNRLDDLYAGVQALGARTSDTTVPVPCG